MRELLRDAFLNLASVVRKPSPGIHIINSHYVTPQKLDVTGDFAIFDAFLQNLNELGLFINLEEAVLSILNNDISKTATQITFTFDDGFEECYTIIAPLLEKHNCRGAFFINANYIDSDDDYQQKFNLRTATHTKKPMTWAQVKDLHNRGHIIGSHNLDHTNLADLNNRDLVFQITENKKILEEKLNYNCDYFAWTYGRFENFPPSALREVEKHHKYIFSGTDYKNYLSYNGKVFNRRHLESFWPLRHLKYFLSVRKTM